MDRKNIQEYKDAGYPAVWPVKKVPVPEMVINEVSVFVPATDAWETSFLAQCSRYQFTDKVQRDWLIDPWVKNLTISPAEQKIIDELVKYDIVWEREVSFPDMKLPSGCWARYDFYLPVHDIIIEYNGKNWHSTPEKIATDKIKQKYCEDRGIKVIVYDSKHYYHMEYEIAELMNELYINIKPGIEKYKAV